MSFDIGAMTLDALFPSSDGLLAQMGQMGQKAAVNLQSTLGFPNVPVCRCMPMDSCWPLADEWNQFNQSLGGKLIAPKPIGSVCHQEDAFGTYDAEKCATLRDSWSLPSIHSNHPSSVMAQFFGNRSCDPFAPDGFSCIQGTYIQYAINATDASDFQKTIQFVKDHNIRLTIRNTGHDYYGKSTGAGAVAIWTRHMKNIEILDYDSATYQGKAIKVGAGVETIEAYEAAHAHGLLVVGGDSDSVGWAGGYSQGGGKGPVASKYGLGADQVLEWEVVTAKGDLLVASPTQNSDLYWALSGGGGGTYGVVVSMTSKAYPDTSVAAADLVFSDAGISKDEYYDATETLHANLPALVDAGGTALYIASGKGFKMSPIMAPGLSEDQLREILQPTLTRLDDLNMKYVFNLKSFPTYLETFKKMNHAHNASSVQIGGRLIPRALVEKDNPSLTQAYRNIHDKGGLVSGFALNVSRINPNEPDNSVHPKWRDALFNLVLGTLWSNTDWDKNIADQALITNELLPEIAKLTPGGGAYLNEADPNQPYWQELFYGPNYARLRKIKKKYDPDDLFYGLTSVGSEAWKEVEDGRLCRA